MNTVVSTFAFWDEYSTSPELELISNAQEMDVESLSWFSLSTADSLRGRPALDDARAGKSWINKWHTEGRLERRGPFIAARAIFIH